MALWTPDDLATEPLGWWDPSDSGTVTLVGSDVSVLDDQTSNGRDLGQSSASVRPSIGTLGGLDALSLDGSEYLQSGALTAAHPPSVMWAIAFDPPASPGHHNVSALSWLAASADWQFEAYDASNWLGAIRHTNLGLGSHVELSGGPHPDPQVAVLVFDFAGTISAYVNGALVASVSGYTTAPDVDGEILLGSNRAQSRFLTGTIGEALYLADITTDTRQMIEGYLAHKWDVALAAGHPWEDGAPTTGPDPITGTGAATAPAATSAAVATAVLSGAMAAVSAPAEGAAVATPVIDGTVAATAPAAEAAADATDAEDPNADGAPAVTGLWRTRTATGLWRTRTATGVWRSPSVTGTWT